MQFSYFVSSTRSSPAHCGQLKILIIYLICGLTIMQHVKNVASIKITTATSTLSANKTAASLSDENGFSVELPKPLQMLANRKPTTYSMEAMKMSTLTSKRHQRAFSHRPTLMDVALQVSAREGLHAMTELYDKLVPNIVRNGHLLEDNHPAALLSKFSESTSETLQQEMAAYATISATKAFRKNYKYFNELARQAHTSKISLRHTALEGLCPPRDPPTCMPASARYRTHDGTCNSRRRPRWGASQMPFNRFLPPEYGDGVDSVRMSVDGGPLASSRFVSLLVHGAREGEAPVTLMTAQWGQLLDHDMTSTAQPRSINGSVPSCCGSTDFHPSCFPIKVPLDDPWLAPLKVRCLEFLRSAPAQRRDCILSWREQTNQATSYIDASPIYSNSVKSSDNARVFRNGLLVFGRGNPTEDACQRGALATHCIRAGDGRSGEQPGLLALHHVWVGEHNRLAMELSQMNLHWSDEKIYQEARRIVGAMFQHITYREFLPIVLGREVCKLFDLELLSSGYYEGYDPKTNPTIANSFAAAAFRFGHSLVQNSYMRCDRFHNFLRNNVSLHEEFQRGDIGSPGSLHRLLRGLVNQRALKRDEFITPELTNHLFQTPGFPFGLDLAAINIQRGRDHGVPPYTAWRVPCGLTHINSWEEFSNVVGPQSAHRISHAYRSVHDIDLFVGGIAERPVVGGLVGPTFACIIAQQFSNSRKGDRFWYENGGFENSFTPAQLTSIRRVSLAQILCRSVGGGTMQPHAFLPTEVEGNERQVCGTGTFTPFDLRPWIENDPFTQAPSTSATQEPDRVFNIVSTDDKKESLTTGTIHVVKDNKVGFPNRQRPTDNKNILAPGSSGFVQGVQVPGEVIRINDKLDIRKKVTPARRPTGTAKPIKGINNKLDKGPTKLTLNLRGVTVRRPQATRRTTPLEILTAEETKQKGTELKANETHARKMQGKKEATSANKKEARTDGIDVEEDFLLNESLTTAKSTELLEHRELDENLEDKEKESETQVRETSDDDNNAEISTRDLNSSTKKDDKIPPRQNVEGKPQNLPGHSKEQLSYTKKNNRTHIPKETNEQTQTKNAEIRDQSRSGEYDNINLTRTTQKKQDLGTINEDLLTKNAGIPTKDQLNGEKQGSRKADPDRQSKNSEDYSQDKLPTISETNSEQLYGELKTGRTHENLTNKVEGLTMTTIEKRVNKEPLATKDNKNTTGTTIYKNNLQKNFYDEEATVKGIKQDTNETSRDKLSIDHDERALEDDGKLKVKFSDRYKTDNTYIVTDETVSTPTNPPPTKPTSTEEEHITDTQEDKIKTTDRKDSKQTYSNSKLNKLEYKDKNEASSWTFETQQTRTQTDKNNDEVETTEPANSKPTLSNSKVDKTATDNKVDDNVEEIRDLTDPELASSSQLRESTDYITFDDKSKYEEGTTIFESQENSSRPRENKNDNAQNDSTRSNHTNPTSETSSTTLEAQQSTEDINPMKQGQTNDEQKRLKRRRTEGTSKEIELKGLTTNNDTKPGRHTKTTKPTSLTKTPTTTTPRKTTITRTTSRQVELRQYQTRPQKVVVNGPNSDQYEIEINIRQTNQKQSLTEQQTASAATNPYTNYPTTYKPYYGYDRYTTNYVGTYHPNNKVTIPAINAQARRTRPPTIIYVDDPEDRYTRPTTPRAPGLFQNILTYATSGLNNFNKQQQASPHSTTNIQKERPTYGAGGELSANGINHIYSPNSHYIPRPGSQTHELPAYPAVPLAASLSQVGSVASSGVVQATSSAISSGNFGSISGVAQANGADSTFSFNIRPKPSQTQLPLPINEINGGGSYGLFPTQTNIFSQLPNPSFGNHANSAASSSNHYNYGNANKPSDNSPFSSANKRPQQDSYYGYYGQKQKLPLQQKTELDRIENEQDYDEFVFARTLEPIKAKSSRSNETNKDDKDESHKSEERGNENDYDYTDDSLEGSGEFERDGYVRPEDVINTVLKSKENELRNWTSNTNCTTKPLDDNYVLPILNTSSINSLENKDLYKKTEDTITTALNNSVTTTSYNVTNFPDIMGKNFNNDILAVDYEGEMTENKLFTPERTVKTSSTKETREKTVETSSPKVTGEITIETSTNETRETPRQTSINGIPEKTIKILSNQNRELTLDTRIERTKTEPFLTGEIAFAPIKILNKLERPDHWLIYDSPENYTGLPELPAMYAEDSSAPTDEVPKPFQGLTSLWVKKIKKDKERSREQFLASKQISHILSLNESSAPLGAKFLTTAVSGNVTLT